MTQQYYPPQGYQQAPAQPAYQPPVQSGPPEWAQPQQQWQPPIQQQFQQPGYGQPTQPPAPAPALANGGLDEFYGQPSLGGGPGISWKGKTDGYTVQGVVPRDVGDGDVTQEVGAPNTAQAGQPQFYRDGRPKYVMAVPLSVPQSPEFPDGEARLYIRGQLRDELARAMAEVGASGAPAAGSVITVTLVQRKQGRGSIPQNIFAVNYTPAGGQAPQIQQAQQQAPVQQYAPQAVQQQQYAPAPVQQFQPQAQQAPAQQYQQAPGGTSPAAGAPQQVQQGYQPPVQQQAQAPVQQAAPQQVAQQPPAPSGLTPEQEQLLAQLNAAKQG